MGLVCVNVLLTNGINLCVCYKLIPIVNNTLTQTNHIS
jgi:hypothetical protein